MLLTLAMSVIFGMSAWAADYSVEGSFTWKVDEEGLYYAYDAVTGELIRNCNVGIYYVDQNGTRVLNQFVGKVYYNIDGIPKKKFKGGWVKTGDKVYYFKNRKKVTGYKKINGNYYFFNEDGERCSGVYLAKGKYRFFKANGKQVVKKCWKAYDGKKWRLSKKGIIKEGFFKIKKKTYYQTGFDGILTGEQTIDGKKYYFDSNGVLDEDMTERIQGTTALGNESDILFFTKFESGSVGYAQTGGDNGKACGKYQFDYRYSLVRFLQYCYQQNETFFAGFKPFIGYKAGSAKLVNNKKLYKAWKACYDADADYFASMQDQFAVNEYYKPVETYLSGKGVNLTLRPYVIRGAVFSYSIQHGQTTAAKAVLAAGLDDNTANKSFLEDLYDYRWKSSSGWAKNSVFKYRYTQERALALAILSTVA